MMINWKLVVISGLLGGILSIAGMYSGYRREWKLWVTILFTLGLDVICIGVFVYIVANHPAIANW